MVLYILNLLIDIKIIKMANKTRGVCTIYQNPYIPVYLPTISLCSLLVQVYWSFFTNTGYQPVCHIV